MVINFDRGPQKLPGTGQFDFRPWGEGKHSDKNPPLAAGLPLAEYAKNYYTCLCNLTYRQARPISQDSPIPPPTIDLKQNYFSGLVKILKV